MSSDVSRWVGKGMYEALQRQNPALVSAISELLSLGKTPGQIIPCIKRAHPAMLISMIHGATYHMQETGKYKPIGWR